MPAVLHTLAAAATVLSKHLCRHLRLRVGEAQADAILSRAAWSGATSSGFLSQAGAMRQSSPWSLSHPIITCEDARVACMTLMLVRCVPLLNSLQLQPSRDCLCHIQMSRSITLNPHWLALRGLEHSTFLCSPFNTLFCCCLDLQNKKFCNIW